MKKKLLLVLFPVLLMMAGALAVWANEQGVAQPGCSKCVKMEQQAPCANCPKAADMEKAAMKMEPGCAKCAKMNTAEATPPAAAPCPKCAKLQPEQQPAEQPAPKPCCNKQKVQ